MQEEETGLVNKLVNWLKGGKTEEELRKIDANREFTDTGLRYTRYKEDEYQFQQLYTAFNIYRDEETYAKLISWLNIQDDDEQSFRKTLKLSDEFYKKLRAHAKKVPDLFNRPPSNVEIHEFTVLPRDIVKAIILNEKIDGIDIVEKIQDPNFRFISDINVGEVTASDLSEAFAILLAKCRASMSKSMSKKATAKSNDVRSRSADEYALKMHEMIENIVAEKGALSLRQTAAILNEKGALAPTPNPQKGQTWHVSTVQALQKRWEKLGLSPLPKPK